MDIQFVCYNGEMIEKDQPVLRADNRGFKFGDGVFETMKWKKGGIVLSHYHFERLFSSLKLLQINSQSISTDVLLKAIAELCELNNCTDLARVRLAVYRGENNKAEYLIEAIQLENTIADWNKKGWVIDLHPYIKKNCDVFANLKSSSYLFYVMAALYAKENQLNDCLVMNIYERICDASIANIFWIKDRQIFTPPLCEGCVAGVMRRYLIEKIPDRGYEMREKKLTVEDLENADEVFLTNAIKGITWVKQFRNSTFSNNITADVNNQFIVPSFS